MVIGTPTVLNLIPGIVFPVVNVNQYDAGYQKTFLLYKGAEQFNIASNMSVTIRGTKGDKKGIADSAAHTVGSNLITVTLTEQMTAVAGPNIYELRIVDTNGLLVGTINFVLMVEPAALGDDTVISDSDLNYAADVLDRLQSVEAFKNQLDTASEDIEDLKADKIGRYDTVTQMKADSALEAGMYALCGGFSALNDFGGGLYKIVASATANNCTVFTLANGLYATRIFTEGYAYLESLNFPAVSMSVVNEAIAAAHLHDIRASVITTSQTIEIKDYNFTFSVLTYTGTGYAIKIDSVVSNSISGDEIIANNGNGILVTCTTRNCNQNRIQVNSITAKNDCVDIRPVNSHGIMRNEYVFGVLSCQQIGYSVYIPANTGHYSWQGEEVVSIGTSVATNSSGTGKGVAFVIDPVNDVTKDGTITGVDFLHLSVEGSDIGVWIRCGRTPNPQNIDACIKSIHIGEMRCREAFSTETFLDADGYIKDLYVRPTSKIRIYQWNLYTSADEICMIDQDIWNKKYYRRIGYTLCCSHGVTYIRERVPALYNPPANSSGNMSVDFSDLANTESDLFMPDVINAMPQKTGKVILNFEYFFNESAENIIVYLAPQMTCEFKFPAGGWQTFTNSTGDSRVFAISRYNVGNGPTSNTYTVRNLGKYWDMVTTPVATT